MDFFKRFLKPLSKTVLLALCLKTLASLSELFLPYILEIIIDDIVPTREIKNVLLWMALMVFCAISAMVMHINANRTASKVARDFTFNVRNSLFDKTIYLSCNKTDEFTIPSLQSRLTSDTYNLHRLVGVLLRMGVKAPITCIGGIVLTFIMDPILALVLFASLPFMAIIVYYRATNTIPMFMKTQKANDKMVGVVRENVQGIRVIKALSKVDYEKKRYQKANNDLRKQEYETSSKMAIVSPSMNLILYLGLSAVIFVGANRVNIGLSKAGSIIAFMSYFLMISHSLLTISRIFIMTSRGIASANRINEVLNTPSEKEMLIGSYPDSDHDLAIEFKDVCFSYLKVKDNLSHINFKLKKGESLGIIGATGSGKTTILYLLLRFYDVDSGAIYINGTDIRNIAPSKLRQMFGMTMQNDFLFSGSINENIEFGRNVTDNDIDRAVKIAQAKEFIDELNDGLDHHLTSKGTNLSGGQRQRVLLSRAFATRPAFLLLDDSSSALDYGTDARLRKAIDDNLKDTTKIIIAQRVSSIKSMDHIMVLENGNINGYGNHDELINNNELYTSISESQMGGALLD